jgi:hypothetical protein
MAARRVTTYLPDEVQAVFGPLGEDDSLSGRLATIVLRYAEALKRSCPTLTVAEWSAIVDACNGLFMGSDAGAPAFIWAEIADADGIGEKWGIDQEGLAQRLRKLPYAAQVAVAEVVEQFWRGNKEGDRETRLREAGAAVAEADAARP